MQVYCDMQTDGGGWTVVQRRQNGDVNFYKGWSDYVNGFGHLTGEFWLGLDNLHQLSHSDRPQQLRVDMWNCTGNYSFEVYSTFYIGDESDGFRLSVAGPLGTGGDAMNAGNNLARVNGWPFTTYDRDNDNYQGNCAQNYRSGGWWFNRCFQANLNGQYNEDCQAKDGQGIIWASAWYFQYYSLKRVEMKVRPRGFPDLQ